MAWEVAKWIGKARIADELPVGEAVQEGDQILFFLCVQDKWSRQG